MVDVDFCKKLAAVHRLEAEEESNFDRDTEHRRSEKVRDRVNDISAFRYPSLLAHNGVLVPEA